MIKRLKEKDYVEDKCEALAKTLKEKDAELAKTEKRIADTCDSHSRQKLFVCRSCDETKCIECKKTCCANQKIFIDDARDDVNNQWQAAKVKVDQLQVLLLQLSYIFLSFVHCL